MTTYLAVLFVHSWLRWAVLIVGVALVARTGAGWIRSRSWSRPDEALQLAFTILLDVQLLLGAWLWAVLSPLVESLLTGPAAGMRNPTVRFFAVEHTVVMVLAVIVAHAGRIASRRAPVPTRRHARAWVAAVLVLLLLALAIPWPSLQYGRPLFRAAVGEAWLTTTGLRPLTA